MTDANVTITIGIFTKVYFPKKLVLFSIDSIVLQSYLENFNLTELFNDVGDEMKRKYYPLQYNFSSELEQIICII